MSNKHHWYYYICLDSYRSHFILCDSTSAVEYKVLNDINVDSLYWMAWVRVPPVAPIRFAIYNRCVYGPSKRCRSN